MNQPIRATRHARTFRSPRFTATTAGSVTPFPHLREPSRPGSYALDTFIDAGSWDQVLTRITSWAHRRSSKYVCLCNVHSVVQAQRDGDFAQALSAAHLCVPDGAPIAWRLRRRGYDQPRISGPDLTWKLLERASDQELPVFFYGSTPEKLERLRERLADALPLLKIAGMIAPPFGAVDADELDGHLFAINRSGARLVFVGLGCPKQEKWMAANASRIDAVTIGVGAAFDFIGGTVKRAPQFMQDHGLEWLHRLGTEPRRLARRYLVTNSYFIAVLLRRKMLGQWPR